MDNFPPIGSTYEWNAPSHERAALPGGATLFATGRGALASVCLTLAAKAAVWLPSYFCDDVIEALIRFGIRVQSYEDLPTHSEPDWQTLKPRDGDVVVAVNFFGVRDAAPWKQWQRGHAGVCLVEDHTHDPLSSWAIHSTADYAFASLRKTVPIPDGAMLWSPKCKPLPETAGPNHPASAAYILAGMIFKKSYLAGGAANDPLYDQMRLCQLRGEELLSGAGTGPISVWSRRTICRGLPADLRHMRERNTAQFLDALDRTSGLRAVGPMFRSWPSGHCPFNPALLFESRELREVCRQNFVRHRVYVTVHWPASKRMSSRAADIAGRALTIPLDYRCRPDQHERIIRLLRDSLAAGMAAQRAA
jgi:hypothetical protein